MHALNFKFNNIFALYQFLQISINTDELALSHSLMNQTAFFLIYSDGEKRIYLGKKWSGSRDYLISNVAFHINILTRECALRNVYVYTNITIINTGGGKGGAMGLQPYLILRVLHWIFNFYHRNIFFSVS